MQIVHFCLRAFQLLFAIVVFGLSVDISKEMCSYNYCNTANSKTTGFTAWAGGFGIIVSIIGIVSFFWDRIRPKVMSILDAIAALLFLAGGIAVAGQLKGFKCSNLDNTGYPDWFEDIFKRLCTQNTADAVFCFFSFIVCLGLVAYGFIKRKEYHSSIV